MTLGTTRRTFMGTATAAAVGVALSPLVTLVSDTTTGNGTTLMATGNKQKRVLLVMSSVDEMGISG